MFPIVYVRLIAVCSWEDACMPLVSKKNLYASASTDRKIMCLVCLSVRPSKVRQKLSARLLKNSNLASNMDSLWRISEPGFYMLPAIASTENHFRY